MRIAVFVGGFPLVSETFILNQVMGLAETGHKVDVFSSTRPGEASIPAAPQHPNLSTFYVDIPPEAGYWELPVTPLLGTTWIPGTDASMPNLARIRKALPVFARCFLHAPIQALQTLDPARYGYQARSLSALYRLDFLRSHMHATARPYDVLHAHFGPVANSFRFACRLWQAPMVATFHGYDFSSWPRKHGPGVYRRLFSEVDLVTVNSDHTRELVQALGCPSSRLRKLPVGLALDSFPFRERTISPGEPVRLLTVGRLVEKKGIEYGIRALSLLLWRRPDLQVAYSIVGEGPLRSRLEKVVEELGLREHVTLHGALSSPQVAQMMARVHVFLLPSVTAADGDMEGQGLVLQEAQASGLPILATDHNGFRESIVPGKSGYLVPERDVDALAERLLYLLEHKECWPEMGRAGRAHVERNYDIPRLNVRLVDLYREAITDYRTAARKARA